MDNTGEIERYDDSLNDGLDVLSRIQDPTVRTQALELWSHVPDLTTEDRRFLPATVGQLADHFSEEDPAAARIALSAASILVVNGEVNSDGSLDEEEMVAIGNIAQAMTAMGLEGVEASYMAEYLGVSASLGGLLALNTLYERILELEPEDVKGIRSELSLDIDFEEDYSYDADEYDDEIVDIDMHSEDYDEYDDDEQATAETEPTDEELSIQHLQEVLGYLGLSGVDVVTLAERFEVRLDAPEALETITHKLSETSDGDISELRFQTDALFKIREPQDIALALAEFRAANAHVHEYEGFGDDSAGTTSIVTDESGEEFEI